MRMLALGVDHRSAPTAVREALAFEGERRQRGLDALKADAPDAEFVLLSTCNRVELYAAAEADPPDGEALAASLARFHDVPVAMLDRHLVARRDEAAVDHLFRVAAGLESLVLGEGQILGQVRDAYKLASDCKAVGPILHHVFQRPCASASGSARRPAWTGASARSPASPSTSPAPSSTASRTRPYSSSAPARWAS